MLNGATVASNGVHGLEPDAPMTTDCNGYKTRATPYRFELMPADALLAVCEVFTHGAKDHGDNNWERGKVGHHVAKAIVHLLAWQIGDRSDSHLTHAGCRILMAIALEIRQKNAPTT